MIQPTEPRMASGAAPAAARLALRGVAAPGLEAVGSEQLRLLFALARRGIAVNLILGLSVAAVFWQQVARADVLVWCFALAGASALRAAAAAGFGRATAATAPRWLALYLWSVIASGLVWGLASYVLGRAAPHEMNVLLMFVLGGMTAGAIPVMAPVLRVYGYYLAAFAIPVMVDFALRTEPLYQIMAAMIGVYSVAMYATARNYEQNLIAALRLDRTNAKLLEDIAQSNSALARSNARLREEIEERRLGEQRFRDAFENAPIGMALCDGGGRILQANRAVCEMLGCAESELEGRTFDELIHPEDVHVSATFNRQLLAGETEHFQIEKRYINKRGDVIWGALSVSALTDTNDATRSTIVQIQDVTATRQLSDRLLYQARHDDLTGLMNRREFEERLKSALESAASGEAEHALCYLDLDQFKIINDTCGHMAGDQLLRKVAVSLQQAIRRSDTIARLGGDEFAILMEYCSVEQAQRAAHAVHEAVEALTFLWEDKRFKVGTSIGLVPIRGGEETVGDILSAADTACFTAKEQGRNRIHTYHPTDEELVRRHSEMAWVERINRALEEGRLQLMFQPIVPARPECRGGLHFELLVRMQDTDGKIIAPGAFLPAAERYHIASRIDRWVVETACRWLRGPGAALADLELCSINLSGQSITNDEFLAFALTELRAAGVPPGKICFEITETAAIANLSAAQRFIGELKALGCKFALDDFGSGLSSFGYLRTLPVDYLKIDGIFVKDLATDPVSVALVRSINEIGQVLGKRTVAEFVENDAIRQKLVEIGVDYVQGYGIGRPQPLIELLVAA